MPETPTTMTPSMSAMLTILSTNHGATVIDLAERGKLGRSTAAKVLTGLETRGLARRQAAERTAAHRVPDLWFSTTPDEPALPKVLLDTDVAPDDRAETATTPERGPSDQDTPSATADSDAHVQRPDDQPESEDGTEANVSALEADSDSEHAHETRSKPAHETEADETVAEAVLTGPHQVAQTAPDDAEQPDAGEDPAISQEARPTADGPAAAPQGSNPQDPAPQDTSAPSGEVPATTAPEGTTPAPVRLAKGGLRALVVEHLTAHPDGEFTSPKLAKILGRSSGAISNVFDTLVKTSQAEMTCEKPRTFRHLAARAGR